MGSALTGEQSIGQSLVLEPKFKTVVGRSGDGERWGNNDFLFIKLIFVTLLFE